MDRLVNRIQGMCLEEGLPIPTAIGYNKSKNVTELKWIGATLDIKEKEGTTEVCDPDGMILAVSDPKKDIDRIDISAIFTYLLDKISRRRSDPISIPSRSKSKQHIRKTI